MLATSQDQVEQLRDELAASQQRVDELKLMSGDMAKRYKCLTDNLKE